MDANDGGATASPLQQPRTCGFARLARDGHLAESPGAGAAQPHRLHPRITVTRGQAEGLRQIGRRRAGGENHRRAGNRQRPDQRLVRTALPRELLVLAGVATDNAFRPAGQAEMTSEPQARQIAGIPETLVILQILQFAAELPLRQQAAAGRCWVVAETVLRREGGLVVARAS